MCQKFGVWAGVQSQMQRNLPDPGASPAAVSLTLRLCPEETLWSILLTTASTVWPGDDSVMEM